MTTAWVLNVDVERELAAPGATLGPPSRAVEAAVAMARERLIGTLVAPDDVVLGAGDDGRARGLGGRAWCPTPAALAALEAAGARVPDAPPLEALRTVNAKPFGARLAGELDEPLAKRVVTNLGDALAALDAVDSTDGLVRRPFGAAGRARRKIRRGAVTEADRAWLRAALAHAAVVIEPWVDVLAELALHGTVERDGSVERGCVCLQEVDANGLWSATRPAGDELDAGERLALEHAFDFAAARAFEAGYFGPLGVDALRYRDRSGVRFQAMNDLNGRYSMGWAIGMGARARP